MSIQDTQNELELAKDFGDFGVEMSLFQRSKQKAIEKINKIESNPIYLETASDEEKDLINNYKFELGLSEVVETTEVEPETTEEE